MSVDDIEKGKEVIRIEAEAVAALEKKINGTFKRAVEIMLNCKGRVIITGMGKSGLIARKIVATMNSTGTPAVYLHPSDAVHGDLGMVRNDDVVICISKSGGTQEICQLLPMLKRINVPIISLVGNTHSQLASQSDVVLDTSVKEEACPYDLAPTASTTATLAMGDALAVTLLEKKNFTADDFAKFHPGGNIGRRLLSKVEEFSLLDEKQIPKVSASTSLKDSILEMTSKRLGATCVVDVTGTLLGIITDGDLRRLLQKTSDVIALTAEEIMTRNPKTILKGSLAVEGLRMMETYNITQLVIVDKGNFPVGMVHLHDLVKAGLGGETVG